MLAKQFPGPDCAPTVADAMGTDCPGPFGAVAHGQPDCADAHFDMFRAGWIVSADAKLVLGLAAAQKE